MKTVCNIYEYRKLSFRVLKRRQAESEQQLLRLQRCELESHEKDQQIAILKAEVDRWRTAHDSVQAAFSTVRA
jgi:hypothetical protein